MKSSHNIPGHDWEAERAAAADRAVTAADRARAAVGETR